LISGNYNLYHPDFRRSERILAKSTIFSSCGTRRFFGPTHRHSLNSAPTTPCLYPRRRRTARAYPRISRYDSRPRFRRPSLEHLPLQRKAGTFISAVKCPPGLFELSMGRSGLDEVTLWMAFFRSQRGRALGQVVPPRAEARASPRRPAASFTLP